MSKIDHSTEKYQEKSHVSMATACCTVCGEEYETGEILLDKRLAKTMYRHTLTGMGLCPAHQKMKDDGFIALVGVTGDPNNNPSTCLRTGHVAHIKASAWDKIFNIPAPKDGVALAPPEIFEHLQRLQPLEALMDLPKDTKRVAAGKKRQSNSAKT